MLYEKYRIFNELHRMFDLFFTAASFLIAYFFEKFVFFSLCGGISNEIDYKMILFIILAIWYFVFGLNRNYSSFREKK